MNTSINRLLPRNWLDCPLESLTKLAPCQPIAWPEFEKAGIHVSIKREDQLSNTLGGNKFYKLYFHLKQFQLSKKKTIASFGGAYSNHLYALAHCGAELGIPTIGFVRGEKSQTISATLADCIDLGMQINFISRTRYREKNEPKVLHELKKENPDAYFIPEGGGGELGAKGCLALAQTIFNTVEELTAIVVAGGTGSTAAGLLAGLNTLDAADKVRVHCVLALKGSETKTAAFKTQILELANNILREPAIAGDAGSRTRINPRATTGATVSQSQLALETRFHCGGYAKFPPQLREFVRVFEQKTQILLDPVYTAKALWALHCQSLQGEWPKDARIVVLHTGGLQGRRGYEKLDIDI